MRSRTSMLSLAFLAAVSSRCTSPPTFADASMLETSADAAMIPPGEPCGFNAQGEPTRSCPPMQICLIERNGFPGGYCTLECRNSCDASSVCLPLRTGQRVCLRRCSTDTDCRIAEGYACRVASQGSPPVCLPTLTPLGRRADGTPCFSAATDRPALGTFVDPDQSVSHNRVESRAETEPVLLPLEDGGVLAAFTGMYGAIPNWGIGLVKIAQDTSVGASAFFTDGGYPDVFAPSLVRGVGNTIQLIALANDIDQPANSVVSVAVDPATLWTSSLREIFGRTDCATGCLQPHAASNESGIEHIVVRSLQLGPRVLHRSRSMDQLSSITEIANRVATVDHTWEPSFPTVHASGHDVSVVWVDLVQENQNARLGDPSNRVRFRRSRDDGATWEQAVQVSRLSDSPIGQPPWVWSDGQRMHVVYVTGGLVGAWDVILATSVDGGQTFLHRRVNDDPVSCATHAFVSLAVDANANPSVLWLENRVGAGSVVTTSCPLQPAMPCARNVRVSNTSFVFGTSSDPLETHGTHSSLVWHGTSGLWAAWSDTRAGAPAIYATVQRRVP